MIRFSLVSLMTASTLLVPLVMSAQGTTGVSQDEAIATRLVAVRELAADQVVVDAVKKQNAKDKTLQQIRAVDIGWVLDADKNPRLYRLINCGCAVRLRQLAGADPAFKEIMVMDDQGALVCITAKTTDYWQGDEDKWIKAFNDGEGAEFLDEPGHDESTGAVLVQVSVPIKDGEQVIGVLTAGIDARIVGR